MAALKKDDLPTRTDLDDAMQLIFGGEEVLKKRMVSKHLDAEAASVGASSSLSASMSEHLKKVVSSNPSASVVVQGTPVP